MSKIEAGWHDFYRAAIFESNPEKLSRRIKEAHLAIQSRIAELREQRSSKESKERMELELSLYFLEALRTTSETKKLRNCRVPAAPS